MEGYHKVAQLMGLHHEFAIVRRFDELNMQDLLYMQSEIIHIKADLEALVERDKCIPDRAMYSRDWWSLAESGSGEETEQYSKVLLLREKLKDYNDRLIQQVTLANLKQPTAYDVEFLRDWFQRPRMGNNPLLGLDRHAWEARSSTSDLVAIKKRDPGDPLSRWFIDVLVPCFHNVLGNRFKKPLPEDPDSEIAHYSDERLISVINSIGTLIASLLPISSIVILHFVSSPTIRLGIAVGFTALFSLALQLITSAKRVEVFAATSAFAAVLVVFLSSNTVMGVAH